MSGDLKAPRYRACPSVREFLLVAQIPVEVDHWVRTEDGEWEMTRVTDRDTVLRLNTLGMDVPVREFYRRIEGV